MGSGGWGYDTGKGWPPPTPILRLSASVHTFGPMFWTRFPLLPLSMNLGGGKVKHWALYGSFCSRTFLEPGYLIDPNWYMYTTRW